MRKILYFVVAIFSVIALQSCKSTQFGVDYAATVTGDGEGKFDVVFPQGRIAMDGTAAIDFRVSNDSSIINAPVLTKQQVIESGDVEQLKALKQCNDYVANNFDAYASQGTYDITIHAYVRERVTGIGFEANKHLTNRTQSRSSGTAASLEDPYPYIL